MTCAIVSISTSAIVSISTMLLFPLVPVLFVFVPGFGLSVKFPRIGFLMPGKLDYFAGWACVICRVSIILSCRNQLR